MRRELRSLRHNRRLWRLRKYVALPPTYPGKRAHDEADYGRRSAYSVDYAWARWAGSRKITWENGTGLNGKPLPRRHACEK